MKFRVFTKVWEDGRKQRVAVNVDTIAVVWGKKDGRTCMWTREGGGTIRVAEDFDTVVSRLNTIAE